MTSNPENTSVEKKLLGEILVKRGVVTVQQLNEALEVQKKDEIYLGEILIRLGYAQERDVVVALVVQCNLPYIAVDNYDIDKSIIQLLPAEIARKHLVVPLDRVGDILSVVMVDPLNQRVRAELQRITKCKIASFIATKEEIENAIRRWYPGEG